MSLDDLIRKLESKKKPQAPPKDSVWNATGLRVQGTGGALDLGKTVSRPLAEVGKPSTEPIRPRPQASPKPKPASVARLMEENAATEQRAEEMAQLPPSYAPDAGSEMSPMQGLDVLPPDAFESPETREYVYNLLKSPAEVGLGFLEFFGKAASTAAAFLNPNDLRNEPAYREMVRREAAERGGAAPRIVEASLPMTGEEIARLPVDMVKGIYEGFASAPKQFRTGNIAPILNSVLMTLGGVHGGVKTGKLAKAKVSAIRGAKTKRLVTEAYELATGGDTAGGSMKLAEALERIPGIAELPKEQIAAIADLALEPTRPRNARPTAPAAPRSGLTREGLQMKAQVLDGLIERGYGNPVMEAQRAAAYLELARDRILAGRPGEPGTSGAAAGTVLQDAVPFSRMAEMGREGMEPRSPFGEEATVVISRAATPEVGRTYTLRDFGEVAVESVRDGKVTASTPGARRVSMTVEEFADRIPVESARETARPIEQPKAPTEADWEALILEEHGEQALRRYQAERRKQGGRRREANEATGEELQAGDTVELPIGGKVARVTVEEIRPAEEMPAQSAQEPARTPLAPETTGRASGPDAGAEPIPAGVPDVGLSPEPQLEATPTFEATPAGKQAVMDGMGFADTFELTPEKAPNRPYTPPRPTAEQAGQMGIEAARARPVEAGSIPRGTEGATATEPGAAPEPSRIPAPPDPRKTLVSPRDIVKTLVDATEQPHRQGRMGSVSRAVGGFFKRGLGVSRARNMYDVPTAAHEIGHGLVEKYRWNSQTEIPKAYVSELKRFGNPLDLGPMSSWEPGMSQKRMISEGAAEYTRRWIEEPDFVREKAPEFTRVFEGVLEEEGLLKPFREAQDLHARWAAQTAPEKLRSQTDYSGEVAAVSENKPKWHGFVTDMVDNLNPIRQVVEAVNDTRYENVRPLENPYVLARLSRGSSEIANKLITEGNAQTMGLKQILRLSGDKSEGFADFQDYARARRLKAYDEAERPTGAMTREEIDQTLAAYDSPEFRQAFDELQKWVDEILEIEKNFHTPEARSAWKEIPDYIPMKRVLEAGVGEGRASAAGGANRKLANQQIQYHGYRGTSKAPYEPWLETLIDRAYNSTQKAKQNDAVLALVDMVQKSPGGGKILEPVPASMIPTDALGVLKKVLDERTDGGTFIPESLADLVSAVDSLPEEMFDLKYWQRVNRLTNGQKADRIIMAMREGVPEFYQIGGDYIPLYEALVGMGSKERSAVLQVLGLHANALRAGVTLDPGFLFYANLVRDSLHSYVVSEGGFIPFWDTARGIKESIVGGKSRDLWIESGGAMSGTGALDRATVRKQAADLQGGMPGADQLLDGIRRLRDSSEMTNRIATFERELASVEKKHPDWTPEDHALYAAFRSRDLLDFAMRGRKTAEATQLIAFARSKINGMAKLGHELVRDPVRIMAHGVPIALATTLLYELNHDDPRYWELSDWERNNYWHVRIPGNEEFVRIPKPHEWGWMFGTVVEDGLRKLQDKDPHAFDDTLRAARDVASLDIPNIAQLAIDISSNRQSYSGAPIVPTYLIEGSSAVRKEDQYSGSTSPIFKRIGDALGVSPAKLEYGAKQVGGPSADYADTLLSWMVSPLTGEQSDRPKTPWRRLTTHLNAYPALADEIRDQEEAIRRDLNSVRKLEARTAMNAEARRLGYDDYQALAAKHKTLERGIKKLRKLEEGFYESNDTDEKYSYRSRMQETAKEYLDKAGMNYTTPTEE